MTPLPQLLSRACDEWATLVRDVELLGPQLETACQVIGDAWDGGHKLLICGNGGSCADAMHLAEELVARFQKNRRALAAIALADPTALTCTGNDFGFDRIFSRQVEALGQPGDVLMGLSTSGNSVNVINAFEVARSQGLKTIALIGKDGGKIRGTCDVELLVPADTAHRVQEGHKLLYHTLCEWADEYAG
jgi:D-sedoheptulose 7-phosphate isomerase